MSESTVHRFPKWLRDETYTIAHDARAPGKFLVTLVRGKKRRLAYGPTIATAAKRAALNGRKR